MGEQLARVELFLLTANLIHRFSLGFPDNEPKPDLHQKDKHRVGNMSASFKICAKERV